jgi:hypothetical protein
MIIEEGTMESYVHIAREIVKARADFAELQFCFEGRQTNKEADNLARSVVYNSQGRSVWFLNPPEGCCIHMTIDI